MVQDLDNDARIPRAVEKAGKHPPLHLAEATIWELPVAGILKITVSQGRFVDPTAVATCRVGAIDGPQEGQGVAQIHVRIARLPVSEDVPGSGGGYW